MLMRQQKILLMLWKLTWGEILGEYWDGGQEIDWLETGTAQGAAQTDEGLKEDRPLSVSVVDHGEVDQLQGELDAVLVWGDSQGACQVDGLRGVGCEEVVVSPSCNHGNTMESSSSWLWISFCLYTSCERVFHICYMVVPGLWGEKL